MIFRTLLLILICCYSFNAHAVALATSNNSRFYYDIGGASSITLPPNAGVRTKKLGGAIELGTGYSCGKFDPTLGLANILNSLQNSGNSLVNGAVGAVTSAIGSLPALILQRINPGLYDLFQNGLIRAEAILALANQSCEQMEHEIKQGKNPHKDWVNLAKSADWKVQMGSSTYGSSSTDVVQAKKEVETDNGRNGVYWIGGKKAGGDGQEAIKTTEDVVKAGYNITMNQAPTSSGIFSLSSILPSGLPGGSSTIPPRLPKIWKSPEEAAEWAVDVAGDTYISTYEGHATESVPGHGLLPKIQEELSNIQDDLIKLVAGSDKPTLKNLSAVSSNDILITRDVIFAIQGLKPTEQGIAINKLASEVAMSRTLEKALYLRRLLLTGRLEPNIGQTPAPKHIDDTVDMLDQEIENILFEKRVRKELMADTAVFLLELRAQHKNRGGQQGLEAGHDKHLIIDGATN